MTLLTWNSTAQYNLDLDAVPSITDPPLREEHIDGFRWLQLNADTDVSLDTFVTKFRTFFIPPSDNDYMLYLLSDNEAQLWMADPDNGTMKVVAD